jgi:hypothetical protein
LATLRSLSEARPPGGQHYPPESTERKPGGCGGAGWCVIPPACAWRLAVNLHSTMKHRAQARWLRRRWLVRHPAGLRPAAGCESAFLQEAPGASPVACVGVGWCVIPPACAWRLPAVRYVLPLALTRPARKASPMLLGTRASACRSRARLSAVDAFISCSRAIATLLRSSALARATRVSASA